MKEHSVRKFWGGFALALSAGAALAATGAKAQTTPATPAPSGDSTVQMEQYVVTGSYLPLSATAPAIPVTTLDNQAISASGEHSNLLDVITKISPVFSGGLNIGPTNGNVSSNFTGGGSQANIRDLPTLVLINGNRVTFDPVTAVGNFTFVDLNMIPVSAVDKVEIVTDGASAIYGSDAVGGVVNIILKSNYNGFEVGGYYGFAPDLQSGHWTDRNFHMTGGVSDGKNSIMLSVEWQKNDPLYQFQVSTSGYTTGTTNYPGVINIGTQYYRLNPSLSAPPAGSVPIATLVSNGTYSGPYTSTQIIAAYNLSAKPTSIIGNTRKSLVGEYDHVFSDSLKLSTNVIYSQTDVFSQLNAQPVSQKIAAGAPFNPTNTTVTAHDRFVSYPRQYLEDTPTIAGAAKLEGQVNQDVSWNVTGTYSQANQHFSNPNLIEQSALTAAETAGTINLFANTLPASTISSLGIFGTAFGEYSSNLTTYQGVVSDKNVFTLPGGSISAAVGMQYRREGYSATADINSLPDSFNWASGTVISPLTVSRNIWGEFAQVVVPIVSPSMGVPGVYSLTTDDAVRHEEYATISKKPTDPLITLRWQPLDEQFTVRGSYTQSFLAPTLFSLFGPSGIGFSSDITNFQPATGAAIPNDGQANTESLSNVGLSPTTAETFTVGFVYSPKQIKGLSVTVDYMHIRESNVVGTPDVQPILQDVETKGAASIYTKPTTISGHYLPFGQVTLNDFGDQSDAQAITKPGQISGDTTNDFVVVNSGNVPGAKLEVIDLAVDYTFDTGIGRFDLSNKETVNCHYWAYDLTGAATELAGHASGQFNTFGGTIPRWRAYTRGDYKLRGWDATLAMTYIPALVDADDGEHINNYYSWDTSIGYTFHGDEPGFLSNFKGISVSVGVNDLFNRQPSQDHDTFVQDNADISAYSPLGRFVYTEVSYKF